MWFKIDHNFLYKDKTTLTCTCTTIYNTNQPYNFVQYYFIERCKAYRLSGSPPAFAIRAYTNFRLRCPEQIERYLYYSAVNGFSSPYDRDCEPLAYLPRYLSIQHIRYATDKNVLQLFGFH